MSHIKIDRRSAVEQYSALVRRDLAENSARISATTFLLGQQYGFCDSEINQIVELCRNGLTAATI